MTKNPAERSTRQKHERGASDAHVFLATLVAEDPRLKAVHRLSQQSGSKKTSPADETVRIYRHHLQAKK
jgi:hypothetical protein